MPLIVLEGVDGSGKSTQTERLRALAARRGLVCRNLHFPRFDAPVFGELIARFLRGELGALESVDPYLAALLYAGDRADAAPQLREWLARGEAVILDRYVYSNVAYQCAKRAGADERRRLKEWILHTEYVDFGIPRPDLSLFLDVPERFTVQRLTGERRGADRDYLCGGHDIHEASLDLQRRVREVYLAAAEEDPTLHVIDCTAPGGGMDTPDRIFERIRAVVEPLLAGPAREEDPARPAGSAAPGCENGPAAPAESAGSVGSPGSVAPAVPAAPIQPAASVESAGSAASARGNGPAESAESAGSVGSPGSAESVASASRNESVPKA